MARAVALGCGTVNHPSLTNDAGTACYGTGSGSSFAGVALDVMHWSSTTNETFPEAAWDVLLDVGNVFNGFKHYTLRVWPVRGGPR